MKEFNIDISTLNKITESSNDLFFVLFEKSGKGNPFYTSSVEKVTGYTPSELQRLPENHYSLIIKEDLEQIKKILTESEETTSKNSFELTYRISSKSGNPIWLKENMKFIRNGNGLVKEKIISVFNITSIKENENLIQKKFDKLEEINASKDKFISIVSHDLRAPFTTLLGFSEILLNEQDIDDEEKNEYLQYIYDSSKTQLDFINCLLDWSRLQTGRVKVEPARLNLKNTIANAITPLTHTAVRKNIDIKFDINPDFYVNADDRLFSQAMVHLTTNAIRFTPEEKTVYISASRFKEGMIEIIVRDEGMGISEENQQKLFRIDQKLVLPGTGGEKGSGMGLTLTKEIIEKHGGHVWFYSQMGEGSEFHITIPEAKNTVLIVEDELSVRALYKKTIETKLPNFEVRTADNGYEAIKMVREILPTIVITDHDMPLMDGVQFVEAMNKKDSGKNIPVIVISAKLNEEIKRSYSRLGVSQIIPKPADLEMLIEAMREYLFQS